MDREGFRNRLKQYKEARGLNPLLKYWEWKETPKNEYKKLYGYADGGEVTDPQDEVKQKLAAYREKMRNYVLNWYNERLKYPEYTTQIGVSTENGPVLNPNIVSTLSKDTYVEPENVVKTFGGRPVNIHGTAVQGGALPEKQIWFGKGIPAWWHEGIGHMVGDTTPGILLATPNISILTNGPKDEQYDQYINQTNEKHSSTWEFRGANATRRDKNGNLYIDPNRKLTGEDVQEMIDSGAYIPTQWKDSSITPEQIADFHNTFASVDIDKSKRSDIFMAADGGEIVPKYDGGTNFVTYNPDELQRNIQRVLHTTPEGEVNPFYNSLDDTYGSVELPEITVTAPYTRKASLAQQARQGREAYYKAGQKAAPVLAAIPLGAGILGAASMFGFGPVLDIIDVASDPTNPLSYIDKFDLSKIKKVDPMSKNAKPISNKIFTDNIKVAGSTNTNPTYLDYGTVQLKDDFLGERPSWVKDVLEFYDTDVMARERKAASDAGVFYYLPFGKNRSDLTFNDKRPIYVREYLDDVDFGGYAKSDMIVFDKNAPFSPDEILVHEGAHLDQYNGKELPFDLMSDLNVAEITKNFITGASYDKKYKQFLLDILDNAYQFTEDYGKNLYQTLEKGATNREMRYNIRVSNAKPGVEELDDIIDKMSDDEILYMLTLTNAYSRDFHKSILESGRDRSEAAAAIRTALKTVPGFAAPFILLHNTNQNK